MGLFSVNKISCLGNILMNISILFALLISFLGATIIYLGSPNQLWRPAALPARLTRTIGFVSQVIALTLLSNVLQIASACFFLVQWLSFLFILFPYIGALVVAHRKVHL